MGSSVTGGGAIPPRFPADLQTLAPLEEDEVDVAVALVVVLVDVAIAFVAASVSSGGDPQSAVSSASVVVVSGGDSQSTVELAVEVVAVGLLPAAATLKSVPILLWNIRRLNLFRSHVRHKQVLGKDTSDWVIGDVASISLGSWIANLSGCKRP